MRFFAALAFLTSALAITIESGGVPGVCLEHFFYDAKHTLVVGGCYRDRIEDQFEVNLGPTRIKWSGGDLCLDAGKAPVNGQWLMFQPCDRRAPGQRWWCTPDGRIALEGQGFCVDLPSGAGENQDGVRVWQCDNTNVNQAWSVVA